jgi:hypothetical protein
VSSFNPKPFLFKLLAAIFLSQFLIMSWSVWRCGTVEPGNKTLLKDRCPEIGQRIENLFGLSLATVLSLLTDTARNP